MDKLEVSEGNYTIKAIPKDNKSWSSADDIELVLILKTINGTKTLGVINLSGISRNYMEK